MEASTKFEHVNRLIPCGIYIEGAYLEGPLACVGCGPDWIFWNWGDNRVARVDLGSASVRCEDLSKYLIFSHVAHLFREKTRCI